MYGHELPDVHDLERACDGRSGLDDELHAVAAGQFLGLAQHETDHRGIDELAFAEIDQVVAVERGECGVEIVARAEVMSVLAIPA